MLSGLYKELLKKVELALDVSTEHLFTSELLVCYKGEEFTCHCGSPAMLTNCAVILQCGRNCFPFYLGPVTVICS